MEWIDINEQEPNDGDLVLVVGTCIAELGKAEPNTIGLVEWWKGNNLQHAKDTCYYSIEYGDITHWCKTPKLI
jgi:hypothetical protein